MRLWPILFLIACDSETEGPVLTTTTASTGTGACTSNEGFLSGTVWLPKEALLTPTDQPADGALLVVTPAQGMPVQVMADAQGQYRVQLPAGQWQIEGEHSSQCSTSAPIAVEVKACEEEEQDVRLETCMG